MIRKCQWRYKCNVKADAMWNPEKNHYSPGAACQWLFDNCAGIRVDGENHFIIFQEMAANLQESGAQVYGVDTEVCYEPTVPLFSVTEGWTGFVDALEDCCEKGIVFKGDTAEELAWAMGVDEKMLADTISDYNACCEAGVDALLGKNTRDSQPWYRISRHGCHGRHNFHKYLLPKADIRCFATTGPRDLPFIREVTM